MARALSVRDLPDEEAAAVRQWAKGVRRGPGAVAGRTRKARNDDPEHREQVALFDWIRRHEAAIPALRWAFAVPNGGKRGMLTAKKLKAEGVRPGVPDVLLPVARPRRGDEPCERRGLVIEMKSATGAVRPEQRRWLEHYVQQQWRVTVCRSAAEARAALCAYLGVADPEGDRP